MSKKFKVFFSWQSDLPSNQTKRFVEDCIEKVKNDLCDTVTIVADESTRNRLGSPDITESIFDKINECDLFIADVSIVGQYTVNKDNDKVIKYIPNSNVVLELGYAAGIVSWDRCICLANTKFGDIKNLPFDLSHRRVTGYSFKNSQRGNEIIRISEIIKNTILVYIDKSLPKKGFSHHDIGGFDFDSEEVKPYIIPLNSFSFDKYNENTKKLIDESKNIFDNISQIELPPHTDTDKPVPIPNEMIISEILKNPELSKSLSLQLKKTHPIKVDTEFIVDLIKQFLDIDGVDESLFYVGNLKEEHSSFDPFKEYVLVGTEREKEKYKLIQELESKLLEVNERTLYLRTFDDIKFIPLAITNCSQKNDERISIQVKVIEGIPINPTSDLITPDLRGCERFIIDDNLVKELLSLPKSGNIKYDAAYAKDAYRVLKQSKQINMMGFDTLQQDKSDYEDELNDYIQSLIEDSQSEYNFTISALRPKETLWLDKVMLIKPVNNKILIEYSIKSNNSTGDIVGTLAYDLSK